MALVRCTCIWQLGRPLHRVLVIDPECSYHLTHPPKET